MEDIIQRTDCHWLLLHVNSMWCACDMFDIADLCACEFYKDDILYCACGKIHFEFTQGPILGNMYGYIIEEKETQNGKLWTTFLENCSEIQMLAPQYDQHTHTPICFRRSLKPWSIYIWSYQNARSLCTTSKNGQLWISSHMYSYNWT